MFDFFVDDVVECFDCCMEIDGVFGFCFGVVCLYDCMWEMFDLSVMWF